jgi:hypothetical protein
VGIGGKVDQKLLMNEWRRVVAALADEGRLRLFAHIVINGPAAAALSSDERRRLAPLVQCGVVVQDDDGALRAVPGRFGELLRADAPRPVTGPQRFFAGGVLQHLPRRTQDRDEVLRYLASQTLELLEPVTEITLTRRLREHVADPAAIRRAMVDAGLVTRTRDGAEYWRTQVTQFDGL